MRLIDDYTPEPVIDPWPAIEKEAELCDPVSNEEFWSRYGRPLKSTTFSDFVRHASEEEKQKVFNDVIQKSCDDQHP